MRLLLVATMLVLGTASCAWDPFGTAPAPASPEASAAPAPAPVIAGPFLAPLPDLFSPFVPPPPFEALGPIYLPDPARIIAHYRPPPPPGRLTLSNFSYDKARVQAVATNYPDCVLRDGMAPADFALPLNGTRTIFAPAGSDVCWRRAIEPGSPQAAVPGAGGWTEWNRAYLTSRRFVDSRL